jgi:hypothetical protein
MFAQRMIISMVLPSAPEQAIERLYRAGISYGGLRSLLPSYAFFPFICFGFPFSWVKEKRIAAMHTARHGPRQTFDSPIVFSLLFFFSFQFLFPLSIILNTARKSSLAESSNFADRAHVKEHSTRSLLSFRPHLFCLHRLSFTTLTT